MVTKAEPRQWWIENASGISDNDHDYINEVYVWARQPDHSSEAIHVIEYSAYAELLAKVKQLEDFVKWEKAEG